MGDEEIVFPIDEQEYARLASKELGRNGMTAIYAICPKERSPTKIGIAQSLHTRLRAIQVSTWHELYLYYAVWLPDKEMALRIETGVHLRLKAEKIIGEWFRVNPTIVKRLIFDEAARVYGGVKLVEHTSMIERLRFGYLKNNHLTFSKNR